MAALSMRAVGEKLGRTAMCGDLGADPIVGRGFPGVVVETHRPFG